MRKVLEIIKGDKAKTQTYCDMVKLGHQMAAADEKKADELNQKMGELQKKLGPEYAALMDGFQDIDLGSEVGQEISSMFAALDGLCGGVATCSHSAAIPDFLCCEFSLRFAPEAFNLGAAYFWKPGTSAWKVFQSAITVRLAPEMIFEWPALEQTLF